MKFRYLAAISGAVGLALATGVSAQQVSPNGVTTLSPAGAIKPTGTWNLGTFYAPLKR